MKIIRNLDQTKHRTSMVKGVIEWARFIVWTGRDMASGVTNMVLLRCPQDAQDRLLDLIGDGGSGQRSLLRHPMMVHSFFAEDLVIRGVGQLHQAELYAYIACLLTLRESS